MSWLVSNRHPRRIPHLLTSTSSYGETGEAIITSTLEVMYPSIEHNMICPFDLASFLHFVLLPECVLLLITKDCKLTKVVDAYKILAASADYGYHWFTFDNDVVEEDGLSVTQVVIHENQMQVHKYQVRFVVYLCAL